VGGLDSGVAGDPAAGIDTTVAMDAAAPSCGCIVAVDLSAIGIQGPARVTDLWHQKDLGIYDKEFSRETGNPLPRRRSVPGESHTVKFHLFGYLIPCCGHVSGLTRYENTPKTRLVGWF